MIPKPLDTLLDEHEKLVASLIGEYHYLAVKDVIDDACIAQAEKTAQCLNEQWQKEYDELKRFDIRQYIPDGKYCDGCLCTTMHSLNCELTGKRLSSFSGTGVVKLADCPKPYVAGEEKADG